MSDRRVDREVKNVKGNPHAIRAARVHVGGIGRIGTAIILALEAAGIRHFSCNDPQKFEDEQLAVAVFSRRSDLGRPKVHVLERFLDGQPGLAFEPIVASNESRKVLPYLERADVIVSCANNLPARLYLERAAISLNKPSIQASAQDARNGLGGLISVWSPSSQRSCFGCLMANGSPKFPRGEVLLPTVTNTVAQLAAQIVVQLIATDPAEFVQKHNLFALDLADYRLEAMQVQRRRNCAICQPAQLRSAR